MLPNAIYLKYVYNPFLTEFIMIPNLLSFTTGEVEAKKLNKIGNKSIA